MSVFDNNSVLRLDLKIARKEDELNVLHDAIQENFSGISARIASPEEILFGKIWFLGDVSSLDDAELLGFNDALDFLNVLEANDNVDIKKLRSMVSRIRLEATLDRLLRLTRRCKLQRE